MPWLMPVAVVMPLMVSPAVLLPKTCIGLAPRFSTVIARPGAEAGSATESP